MDLDIKDFFFFIKNPWLEYTKIVHSIPNNSIINIIIMHNSYAYNNQAYYNFAYDNNAYNNKDNDNSSIYIMHLIM